VISKRTGEGKPVAVYKDPETGMEIPTDPGWSYNPGMAAFAPDLRKYDRDISSLFFKDHPSFSHIKDKTLMGYLQSEAEACHPEARIILEKLKFGCKYSRTRKMYSYYSPDERCIYISESGLKAEKGTFLHEFGHFLDSCYSSTFSDELRSAMKKDASKLSDVPEIAPGGKYRSHLQVSDLFSAATNGRLEGTYKHTQDYWSQPKAREKEAFANLFSIWAADRKAWREIVERYFPETALVFLSQISRL